VLFFLPVELRVGTGQTWSESSNNNCKNADIVVDTHIYIHLENDGATRDEIHSCHLRKGKGESSRVISSGVASNPPLHAAVFLFLSCSFSHRGHAARFPLSYKHTHAVPFANKPTLLFDPPSRRDELRQSEIQRIEQQKTTTTITGKRHKPTAALRTDAYTIKQPNLTTQHPSLTPL
jgi:hypothetical protein